MNKCFMTFLTFAFVAPAFGTTLTCTNIYGTKLVLNTQSDGTSQFTLTLPEGALNGTLKNSTPSGPYALSGSIHCTTNPNDPLLVNCLEEGGSIDFAAQGVPTVQVAAIFGVNLEEVTTASASGTITARALVIDLTVQNSNLGVAAGFAPVDFGPLDGSNLEASCKVQ